MMDDKNKELRILYEDAELMVCHKPAGIAVQSARVGQKDMVSILKNHFVEEQMRRRDVSVERPGKETARREVPSIYVVHRLDQPVEGVLVFAKTKQAAAGLSRQVADGSMRKLYQAVCCVCDRNANAFESGREYVLVDYLVKSGRTNTSSVAEPGYRDAKRAELSFRVIGEQELASEKSCLLVEIELKTGRHHQIRVQMAHAGLPLYGDRKYNEHWQEFLTETDRTCLSEYEEGKIPLALCAVSLSFRHPASGRRMEFRTTGASLKPDEKVIARGA